MMGDRVKPPNVKMDAAALSRCWYPSAKLHRVTSHMPPSLKSVPVEFDEKVQTVVTFLSTKARQLLVTTNT